MDSIAHQKNWVRVLGACTHGARRIALLLGDSTPFLFPRPATHVCGFHVGLRCLACTGARSPGRRPWPLGVPGPISGMPPCLYGESSAS